MQTDKDCPKTCTILTKKVYKSLTKQIKPHKNS